MAASMTADMYPLIYSIPGLADFVYSKKYDTASQLLEIQRYVQMLLDAPKGGIVEVPLLLLISDANEIASIVLQHQQRQKNHGGTVEVKKVAEIRGSRFNTGKLRMDLIDPLAMEGLAAVLTAGAVKYSAHNWRQGLPYMETVASLLRHTMAIARGEDIDPETGLMHADHIQCNAMFLSNMMKTRRDMDDRWKPLATTPEQVEAAMQPRKSS